MMKSNSSMQQQSNNKNGKHPGRLAPLLRSVLVGRDIKIQRLALRKKRWNAKAEPNFAEAIKANNGSNADMNQSVTIDKFPSPSIPINHHRPDAIEEEYLQDFLRWASQQTVAALPCVTEEQPLLPTRIVIPTGIPLEQITQSIAECLQRLQEKNILFCYRPHPEHVGRIELGSLGCHLKFVIQLWKQKSPATTTRAPTTGNTSSINGSGELQAIAPASVVVELQRRRGCCVFMHHLRRPLFKALEELAALTPERQEVKFHRSKTDTPPAGLASLPVLVVKNKTVDGGSEIAFPPPLRLPSF